jgi:hypothetical protein
MMSQQSTASGNSRIAIFDDTTYRAKLQAFQQYLSDCNEALAVSRKAYKGTTECKGTDGAKAQKPTRKPLTRMSGVYLLANGASCEPITASRGRHFVAPLWASIGDESEGKRAA